MRRLKCSLLKSEVMNGIIDLIQIRSLNRNIQAAFDYWKKQIRRDYIQLN